MVNKSILNESQYDFLRENEHLGENIILLAISGSRGYGTNTDDSDIDIRGCATLTSNDILTGKDFGKISDEETDTLIYSFNTLINMLSRSNPNVLELMGLPKENYLYVSNEASLLLSQKDIFISKKCIDQFRGYANGQMKMVSKRNDLPKERLGKCMMHAIRAYIMVIDLLEKGEIITYRHDEHEMLMSLRRGDYLTEKRKPTHAFNDLLYEYKMRFHEAAEKTKLPEEPDYKKINELLISVNRNITINDY